MIIIILANNSDSYFCHSIAISYNMVVHNTNCTHSYADLNWIYACLQRFCPFLSLTFLHWCWFEVLEQVSHFHLDMKVLNCLILKKCWFHSFTDRIRKDNNIKVDYPRVKSLTNEEKNCYSYHLISDPTFYRGNLFFLLFAATNVQAFDFLHQIEIVFHCHGSGPFLLLLLLSL